ncbi:hypothetical protein GCM10011581_42930 [Saccharopolyspora subtropica]|uniref:Uncharacterized protein n=1 Tax=Saccharopolyspora thermophila TaxID=89367 RepID=A0A917NHJ4_9PSEU|nr:type VII secretion target [Saccharopolyspora subtropica]GGJ01148.1 hypothetical protein GCM10011581_42930 [Saccharopolyspora subtropica]
MEKVKAEPEQLRAAGTSVVAAAQALSDTVGGLELGAAGRDMPGTITAALLPSFAAEWRHSVQQLATAVRGTGEQLQASATGYAAIDRNAADILAALEGAVRGGR